jgi:tRNA A-37 threonylcarbamoyl transferase component Bud32
MDSSAFYSDYTIERSIKHSSFPTTIIKFNSKVPGKPERAIMKAYPKTQIYRAYDEFSNLKKGAEVSEEVCKPYYKSAKDDTINLFLEYVPGKPLEEATQEEIYRNIEVWCMDLVECLADLHHKSVSHNNLAGHILYNPGGVRLIGFGKSTSFNYQNDVKSLGLLVLSLLVPGSLHLEGSDAEESQARLKRLEFEGRVSDKVKQFVRSAVTTEVSMKKLRKVLTGGRTLKQVAAKEHPGWSSGEDGSSRSRKNLALLKPSQEERKGPRLGYDSSSDQLDRQGGPPLRHHHIKQAQKPPAKTAKVSLDISNPRKSDSNSLRSNERSQLSYDERGRNPSLQVPSSSQLIDRCSMCNQRLSTNFTTLTCTHSFHTACLIRFLEDKSTVVQLYKELKCPDCAAAISFDCLKPLPISNEALVRLTLLQGLLVPARCRSCEVELMYPVLNAEFKAYRVTCHRCYEQSCSFCAETSTHWFGCKKAKKALKKWNMH